MGFYERLETLRKNVGIGQGKLEKELGIANGSISKWKNRIPKYGTLVKIANFFDVSVEYLIYGESTDLKSDIDIYNLSAENMPKHTGMYIGKNGALGLEHLTQSDTPLKDSELSPLKGGLNNPIRIKIANEPEIHLHSKSAYDLVKMIATMPEEDLEFLANTAERISPRKKKNIIVVENPGNTKKPRKTRESSFVPFPQYPTVTNKDIDEFAARNIKKKFTREEIAEMLYEMKKED